MLDFEPGAESTYTKQLLNGERKVIYPILLYLSLDLEEHKKRAYLAHFLVELAVPSHLLVDEEMVEVHDRYKELQDEFSATHKHVDSMRKESMNPKELQKKITQLEQEKEQLINKINIFKKKHGDNPDFLELVESTSMLRKEQEEGSRLFEKLQEQKQQMEWCEQQLLIVKQKLIDAKKASGHNTSPEKMLEALKTEVKRNRDLCYEILGRELQEKMKRLQQVELILNEPTVHIYIYIYIY